MATFKKTKIEFYLLPEVIRNIHPQQRIRDKVINALESGDYKQHRHSLCNPEKPGTACCLHVAAISADGVKWEQAVYVDTNGQDNSHGMPSKLFPHLFVNASGMRKKLSYRMQEAPIHMDIRDQDGAHISSATNFAHVNDKYRLTFAQIAQLLRGERVTKHFTEGQIAFY